MSSYASHQFHQLDTAGAARRQAVDGVLVVRLLWRKQRGGMCVGSGAQDTHHSSRHTLLSPAPWQPHFPHWLISIISQPHRLHNFPIISGRASFLISSPVRSRNSHTCPLSKLTQLITFLIFSMDHFHIISFWWIAFYSCHLISSKFPLSSGNCFNATTYQRSRLLLVN